MNALLPEGMALLEASIGPRYDVRPVKVLGLATGTVAAFL